MPDTLERDATSAWERRARQAQALVDVSRDIRYDEPLSQVLASLAANIVEHTRASSVAATLLDPADLSSIAYGESNVPPGYTDAMIALRQQPEEAAQLRRAVAGQRTWVLRDARNSMLARPAYAPMQDMIRQVSWQTVVGTAFAYRPEAMAVVHLCYDADVEVDEEEVSFARAIAFQTAPAMDNAWLFSEAQRRTRELEALSRADAELHRSLRFEDVSQAMADLAIHLLGADQSILGTWDADGRSVIAAASGFDEETVARIQQRYRDMGALRPPPDATHETALIEDVATDPRADAELGIISQTTSVAAVPVRVSGELYGFFQIGFRRRRRFSDADRRLFETLATRAGLAIQNALMFEDSKAQTRELDARVGQLEALHRADAAMHESLRTEDVFQTMADLALDLLGAHHSVLVSWDDDDRLRVRASGGMTPDQALEVEQAYSIYDRATLRGRIHHAAIIEDARSDDRLQSALREQTITASFVELPVIVANDLFGFFTIGFEQQRSFDDDDRRMFDTLAARAGLAIHNALLYDQSRTRADELALTVRQLEALHRADAAMHESLQLQDVLQTMADLAVDLLGADKSIFGWWGTTGEASIPAARGFDAATLASIEKRYRELGLRGYGSERPPQTTLIEDLSDDSQADSELGRIAGVTSVAALSVLVNGDHFGFLQIGYVERHRFTEADTRLFDQLASRAGLAIQNALLFEASVAQTRELDATVGQLEALARADAALHESLRPQAVFEVMVDLARSLLRADKALLTTVNPMGRLDIRAVVGMSAEQVAGLEAIYRNRSSDRYTGTEQKIEMVEDLQNDPRVDADVRALALAVAYADIPIFVDGDLFGFFIVGYDTTRTFVDEDSRLFDTLASRAALAIQNALLFEESTEQTRELDAKVGQLEALSRADASLHESLRLQDVFETMVDLATEFVGADRSLLIAWNGDERLHAYAARGVAEAELAALNDIYHTVGKETFEGSVPQIAAMEDVRTDPTMHPGVRAITPAVSTVDIPVVVNGEMFGLFVISWLRPRRFHDDDMKLFEALGSRTALAIQNAQLYEQSAAQTVELAARVRQLEALSTIAANLTLDPGGANVYDKLAEQVLRATSALACAVIVLEGEDHGALRTLGTAGLPPGFGAAMDDAYLTAAAPRAGILSGEPSILPNGRIESFLDDRYARPRELLADAAWDTVVSRPLIYHERPLGMLVAGYPASWEVDEEEVDFLAAIADQGAIAVANARLMESASNLATVEERQRLARELHDSVSQALYGIALGARTARRRLGEHGDPLVVEAVEYVLSLAEAGLTETRALIFELIPESLANEGLAVAVKRQAAAIQARHQIAVHLELGDEPDLPLKTKEAMYRIAQESLNNVAKHARAQNAYVTLESGADVVRLEVRDDGAGFDPTGEFPGHLGLISMSERARRIGATYAIQSAPGKGATVTLAVPL